MVIFMYPSPLLYVPGLVDKAVEAVEHDVGEHADAEGFPKDPRPRHLLVVRVVDVDPQRVR